MILFNNNTFYFTRQLIEQYTYIVIENLPKTRMEELLEKYGHACPQPITNRLSRSKLLQHHFLNTRMTLAFTLTID